MGGTAVDPSTKAGPKRRSEGPPEAEPHWSWVVPALIAFAGVSGSVLLMASLRSRDRVSADSVFQLEATRRIDGFRRTLDDDLEQLDALAHLYRSSLQVEAAEFATFTEGSCAPENPSLLELLWVEEQSQGSSSCPVRFAKGQGQLPIALGSDISARRELLAALERCRRTGKLAVSAPFRADAAEDSTCVLAALSVSSRDGSQQGFVCGVLDVEHLLAEAGQGGTGETPPGLELYVEDVSTAEPRPIAGKRAAGEPWEKELALDGSSWRIGCNQPSGFAAAHRTWKPWVGLVCGLVATALLVAIVATTSGRARIQRLVEERTREVRLAYATLAQEGKERLSAVVEAQLLEQRLRQIIDLVPNMIYLKDWFGRYLLANRSAAEAHGTTVERLTGVRIDLAAAAAAPDEALVKARALMKEKRSSVVPALPFVDARGRRRTLRQVMIPCDVLGESTPAILCVATDITEQKQVEEMLRGQNEILRELARGANPDRILAETVRKAEEIVPGMRCSVLLLSADGAHLRHGFAPTLPDFYNEAIDGLAIGPEVGSCGAAAHKGERVIVEDVTTHPNWAPFRDLAARAGLRACWSQPIRASDGEILGTFAMYYSEPRGPEPFEEKLIESMAYLAGIAIERGRLEARP